MAEKNTKKETDETKETPKPKCGVIMPISPIDGCSAEHWAEVKGIIEEVVSKTEFECDLVSNANEITVIHETIVQNIYFNEMVICDVSGKNPNVMFELGLRIAFDKPAIIIKDDATDYSFDTSPIEQLTYPRDLNYGKINAFKELLKNKLTATYEKSKADNYSPFLKSFGRFKVASLDTQTISSEAFILKSLESLNAKIDLLANSSIDSSSSIVVRGAPQYELTNIYKHNRKVIINFMKDDFQESDKALAVINDFFGNLNGVSRLLHTTGSQIEIELEKPLSDIKRDKFLDSLKKENIKFIAISYT